MAASEKENKRLPARTDTDGSDLIFEHDFIESDALHLVRSSLLGENVLSH